MIKAVSSGGIVIHHGKILLLYKNYRGRYEGWVMPKGTVEPGETYQQTAIREVKEETSADAEIVKYVGKSSYNFRTSHDMIHKEVHWYLMTSKSFYSNPQKEEYFEDSGYYKYHEAYHLLRFSNERDILEEAWERYHELKSVGLWPEKDLRKKRYR
ncbi:MAG: NUDIX hydrolase [Lachnospiraceae bacterium]|nr:NUDIX hydrolase [Lachnospiraceae bacterium]